jgi:hypothetical protein
VPNPAAISWRWFAGHVIVATGIAARHVQNVGGKDRSDKPVSGISRVLKGEFIMRLVKRTTRGGIQRK